MTAGELGALGERLAAEELERLGWRILERNFRCRLGEVDIIAEKAGVLAFVEVKTRSGRFAEPREYVTATKQRKLRSAAGYYLASHPRLQELQPRFDVMEVGSDGVTHLEDAF